ncbi:MAG: translesion error-prone DNA polymerase V autoproteolytic subunit [Rickettsiales bacterium]|jgi:DNA polymerase V|nr:translesion error-prone DNA polymerase V autoproteolytic subunit [Rickettsiales bacterium]
MARGGTRLGAGRPKGQGKYKEPTKPIRIPETMIDQVMEFVEHKAYQLPFYSCTVQAGFPSPADDYMEDKLDLNKHLVKHPTATFFVRAAGNSMINAGIHSGDILVVDRSLEAKHGKIVIASIDGQLTVKRLHISKNETLLMPENDDFEPIKLGNDNDIVIWGVVTNVLHSV